MNRVTLPGACRLLSVRPSDTRSCGCAKRALRSPGCPLPTPREAEPVKHGSVVASRYLAGCGIAIHAALLKAGPNLFAQEQVFISESTGRREGHALFLFEFSEYFLIVLPQEGRAAVGGFEPGELDRLADAPDRPPRTFMETTISRSLARALSRASSIVCTPEITMPWGASSSTRTPNLFPGTIRQLPPRLLRDAPDGRPWLRNAGLRTIPGGLPRRQSGAQDSSWVMNRQSHPSRA